MGVQTQRGLLELFSAQMRATAQRYSDNDDDAEDAFQRAAEIVLTQPSAPRRDPYGWAKAIAKHEALAIRKARDRVVALGAAEQVPEPDLSRPGTVELAERFERLSVGAEALAGLKPQEIRCLTLKAEGYSYEEICAKTGFSYTKVDRCMKEGRKAFAKQLKRIEAGLECRRLEPLLSALADGEASPEAVAAARPHLRTCLACRARLREYRAVPARVAALAPPVAVTAGDGGSGRLRALAESAIGAIQDRVAALGDRAHQAAELAGGQKAAAVAASAAALAGGGAAGADHLSERAGDANPPAAQVAPRRPEADRPESPQATPPGPSQPAPRSAPVVKPEPAPRAPTPAPPREREFTPAPQPAPVAAAPSELNPGGGSAGSGEFGP